jgi:hypothetical protein
VIGCQSREVPIFRPTKIRRSDNSPSILAPLRNARSRSVAIHVLHQFHKRKRGFDSCRVLRMLTGRAIDRHITVAREQFDLVQDRLKGSRHLNASVLQGQIRRSPFVGIGASELAKPLLHLPS